MAHALSAADSRTLSPIRTERGAAACWEQMIWGICQVLVDSKQRPVRNTLPWLDSLLPTLLSPTCSKQHSPPSWRRTLSSTVLSWWAALSSAPYPRTLLYPSQRRHRFACEGATTPRRPSPVTLPTVGEAAWSWMEEEDKENKQEQNKKNVCCCKFETSYRPERLKDRKRFWKLVRTRLSFFLWKHESDNYNHTRLSCSTAPLFFFTNHYCTLNAHKNIQFIVKSV